MKKLNLKGKLSFNKQTIAKLNNEQMAQVLGGATVTNTCNTAYTCPWAGTLCGQASCNTCEGATCVNTVCGASCDC